jgi:hypothetical protein
MQKVAPCMMWINYATPGRNENHSLKHNNPNKCTRIAHCMPRAYTKASKSHSPGVEQKGCISLIQSRNSAVTQNQFFTVLIRIHIHMMAEKVAPDSLRGALHPW